MHAQHVLNREYQMTEQQAVLDDNVKEPYVLDFDAIFNKYMAQNQKTWAHDRSQSLGASETFDCIRKGFFSKRGKELGFEPDEDFVEDWGALERGNIIENNFVVPAVKHTAEGVDVLFTGDDQTTLVSGRSSATPDGLITGLPRGCKLRVKAGSQDIVIDDIISDCVALEIKSIDPRATLLEERAKHHGQTQMQLGLFHSQTEWKPYYSIILYIDASFLSKLTPFVVKFDEKVFATGKARGESIWLSNEPTDYVPEGAWSGACEHCKWQQACGRADVNNIPAHDNGENHPPETIASMDAILSEYFKKKEEAGKNAVELGLLQEQVKAALVDAKTRKMACSVWNVSWYGSPGQRRVSLKALEEDGIDLEKYKRDGNPFDTLRITQKLPDIEKPKKPRKKKQ